MTLIMTVLLTLSVFLSTTNDSLPPSSDSVPTLGFFLLIVMVEVSSFYSETAPDFVLKKLHIFFYRQLDFSSDPGVANEILGKQA